MKHVVNIVGIYLVVGCLGGCHYVPGPDKQGGGMLQGAATGAVSGAVTGIQLTSSTGPGALAGAGVGAVAGALQGSLVDTIEEDQHQLGKEIVTEAEIAQAHRVLAEHYERRLELHPTRDIYPADYFFYADQAKLNRISRPLVKEIARLNKERLPWSRLVITSYVRSKNTDAKDPKATEHIIEPKVAEYSTFLAEERAKALMNELVRNGIEPRRIEARAMIIDAPVIIDPKDDPIRYNQAIEITPVDR